MSWYSEFDTICQTDAPLSRYTWYKLGGPARWLFEPRDEAELARLLNRCRENGIAWRVLGHGANLLVRDAGFDGAVIRLESLKPGADALADCGLRITDWADQRAEPAAAGGPRAATVTQAEECIAVAAGADFPKFVRKMIAAGRVGLEALAGIPGTIGGIVRMNAGGRYGEVKEFIRAVRIVDASAAPRWLDRDEVGFRYRHTDLQESVIVGATFELAEGDPQAALERYREIWNEKYAQQPPVSARSAGCIFKNPPGYSAGRLIDQAGLKGARAGGAEISEKHANFIVARNGATAADVLKLIETAQHAVSEQFGIRIETEVEIW